MDQLQPAIKRQYEIVEKLQGSILKDQIPGYDDGLIKQLAIAIDKLMTLQRLESGVL